MHSEFGKFLSSKHRNGSITSPLNLFCYPLNLATSARMKHAVEYLIFTLEYNLYVHYTYCVPALFM